MSSPRDKGDDPSENKETEGPSGAVAPGGEEVSARGIDPDTYQRPTSNQGEGEKERGEEDEDKKNWRDKWKSHLLVSGIVVVVLGVFVAFARKFRERSS